MRYSLAILEEDHDKLLHHVFSKPDVEGAAYLLCRIAEATNETVLLVRDVIPVEDAEVIEATRVGMKISSRSYTRAMKQADLRGESFVFVHSHPDGMPSHSPQDDKVEPPLFRTAFTRIKRAKAHASLVCSGGKISGARAWISPDAYVAMEKIRIVGRRLRFWLRSGDTHIVVPEFFDRQVRAFGSEIQLLLRRLHVGVVGLGGTGSCVVEQLTRLGVGTLTLVDGQQFESSNVNRVYGSRSIDDGIRKTKISQRLVTNVGLDTRVNLIDRPITFESAMRELRSCDAVFGCTDDEWGRSLLTRFALYYYVPVFDMGVKISSEDGVIRSINGRVTTLMPGTACLFCRGRVNSLRILAEEKTALDPVQAAQLKREGYLGELDERAPAVIPFTSMVASTAISEFLHRLTGFLGSARESSEVLHLIDQTRVRTNNRPPLGDCFCVDRYYWGRGDASPFLDVTWRSE